MRTLAIIVVLGVVGVVPLAHGDVWRARPTLQVGAPPVCGTADVSDSFFDFSDLGNELSLKPSRGVALLAPIGPTGRSPRRSPFRSAKGPSPCTSREM